jgi:hypothetical protein
MLTETFPFSNHHSFRLPKDFILPDSILGPYTNGAKRGKSYQYFFEAMNVNLKYRFLSRDAEHQHFRMAAYLDLSGGNEAHFEAEPNLIGDNGGAGTGIISTFLLHKFAVSVNIGGIIPTDYIESANNIRMSYGKAAFLNLSFGYLLFPTVYKNYRQTNVNLYAEFQCKTYGGARIADNGQEVRILNAPSLQAGSYIEFRPSVQFILHSNTRIDCSISTPLYNTSWTHNDPVYFITIQQSIFFKGGD